MCHKMTVTCHSGPVNCRWSQRMAAGEADSGGVSNGDSRSGAAREAVRAAPLLSGGLGQLPGS